MGCTTYPAIPFIAAVPARAVYHNEFLWSAGANSGEELDGDLHVVFSMPQVVGVVVGFSQSYSTVEDYTRMSHAFYFSQTPSGGMIFSVIEDGIGRTDSANYFEDYVFEIRRVNGDVTYWVDGELFARSHNVSAGALRIGASLYATGDSIP